MNYNLIPGEGLDDLKFGATTEECEKLLGAPAEIEKDDDEFFRSLIWIFPDEQLTLFFQDGDKPFLIALETSHPETTLFKARIFDMSEEELIAHMKKNGIEVAESEDEEWGEHRVSFDESMMDFYFENKQLTTVNWSIITEDDEE